MLPILVSPGWCKYLKALPSYFKLDIDCCSHSIEKSNPPIIKTPLVTTTIRDSRNIVSQDSSEHSDSDSESDSDEDEYYSSHQKRHHRYKEKCCRHSI